MEQLTAEVRSDPASPKHRIFLFQLLAITGQWDRAATQLDTLSEMDDAAVMMAQMYRTAIDCEKYRAEVFAGRQSPMIFGEPQPWIALMLEALKQTAAGRHAEATKLRDEALQAAEPTAGTLDGQAFNWIMDGDSRLGPILEVIVNGRYYWAPFARIARLRIEPPEHLRDAVWAPAQITWSNGGETVALVPTRYPGSASAEDHALKLARLTQWQPIGDGAYLGLGQRMLATDVGEHPLLEVRDLVLETAAPKSNAQAASAAGEAGTGDG
jgi:type VI secretion system protein ImpE